MISWGKIYKIFLNYTKPPKDKYVICVHVAENLFLIINTEPRTRAPEAQLKISPQDINFLRHDSFIDTSTIISIPYESYLNQIKDPDRALGDIPPHVKLKIKLHIENSKYLTTAQKNKLLSEIP